MSLAPPVIDDLRSAAAAMAGISVRTPLVDSPSFSERLGRRVLVKAEMLQRTGSFKFRGAFNFLSRIQEDRRAAGIVAFSSGNHAQGAAAAARWFGVPATIVMPADAPSTKVARTEGHGARVLRYDRLRDDREAIAAEEAERTGATVVPPYDHPWTIAGQGTLGLEIAEDCGSLGVTDPIVLVPVSGGGLAAGVALALEADLPGADVHAVEPAGFDDHALSLAAGERVAVEVTGRSVCDALQARIPGEVTFAVNRRLLAAAHAVTDEAVMRAVAMVFQELRLVVEPSGVVGVAALLEDLVPQGRPVVAVLSGGNVDIDVLAAALA